MATMPADRSAATTKERDPVSARDELGLIDAYWRAANYLSVGQIYLLQPAASRTAEGGGHQAAAAGTLRHNTNFVYAHMNRVIRKRDLDAIFIAGPGHGGPGVVANTYLEGTHSEIYPGITRDAEPSLPPVLLPGRHPEPRRTGNARQHPRGW
jgi:xylulose-5-phosphate/fructose-6-phosphate phosphoketolase